MQVSTGLDRSKPLLARAKKLAEEANVEVTWIEQDMRDLPGGARFAAVLNLWGSFGYFDDAGNRRFLESAFESLRPDGQLVIDAPTTENFFAPFEARHFGKRGPVWMLQEANYDVLTGLNHGTFTLIHEDGRQATIPHAIRIYGVPEIRALLLDVGFREVRAFSAFGEEPAAVGKRPLIVATR